MVVVFSCDDDLSQVGMEVETGKTVVYPTDTVYGLGTNPCSSSGVGKCFKLKGRTETKPMPILFSDIENVRLFVLTDDRAETLAKKFWPGKLTMVLRLKESSKLDYRLIGPSTSIGVRIPNHLCCLKLIRCSGGCLVGTSANLSGTPPTVDSNDARLRKFSNKADFFVKGKCGKRNQASTVIDLTSDRATILREGAISKEEIACHL